MPEPTTSIQNAPAAAGLYREAALAAGMDRHLGEPHAGMPRSSFMLAVALLCLIAAASWLIGRSEYGKKVVVPGTFDETAARIIRVSTLSRVEMLAVTEGQRVRPGQLLATVSDDENRAASGQEAAEIQEQLGYWQGAREALSNNDRVLRGILADRKAALQQLRLLALSDEELQAKKISHLDEQLARMRSLLSMGYLSKLDWLKFQTARISEQQQLNDGKRRRINLARQHQLLDQEFIRHSRDYRTQLHDINLRLSDLRIRQNRLAQATSREIHAPVAGLVSFISVPQGASLLPGQTLMYLDTGEHLSSGTLFVSAETVGHLQQGQLIHLEVDAYPAEKHGRLMATIVHLPDHRVVIGSDEVYAARLSIEIPDDGRQFLPGMQFRSRIQAEKRSVFARLFAPLRRFRERFS